MSGSSDSSSSSNTALIVGGVAAAAVLVESSCGLPLAGDAAPTLTWSSAWRRSIRRGLRSWTRPRGRGPAPSRVAGMWRFTGSSTADRPRHLGFRALRQLLHLPAAARRPLARYKGARDISAADLAKLREELDTPVWKQFLNYLKDPLQLDSYSTIQGKHVWDVIGLQSPGRCFLWERQRWAHGGRRLDRRSCWLETRQPLRPVVDRLHTLPLRDA